MYTYIYIWIQTLSEKVRPSLQMIVKYIPVPLPKKVRGSKGINNGDGD